MYICMCLVIILVNMFGVEWLSTLTCLLLSGLSTYLTIWCCELCVLAFDGLVL
jgi:hypothetical protein